VGDSTHQQWFEKTLICILLNHISAAGMFCTFCAARIHDVKRLVAGSVAARLLCCTATQGFAFAACRASQR
jgi:hypothetical protein